MASGRITALRADRGFGFIKDEADSAGNRDVFFPRSSVIGTDYAEPREGQQVTFRTETDPRDAGRSRATDVRLAPTPS